MYIIMSNKLPNIRNAYNYPINNKAKAKHNRLVVAMQLLGIVPSMYIQNHTPPPKPKRSRSSNLNWRRTKKPREPVGTWTGTNNTIPIGESFLKYDGTPFTAIDQKTYNFEKELRKLHRKKTVTSQVTLGGNVNVKQRKKAFDGKQNKKTNVRAPARGRRLSLNKLARFEGAAPKPTQTPHSSRNGRVVLTVR